MKRQELHNDKFITRMLGDNVAGWRVQIMRGGVKVVYAFFSDVEYKSTEAAHEAALSFRDSAVERLKIRTLAYDGNGFYNANKNNTSGAIGVSLTKTTSSHSVRYCWSCRVMKNGKQVNRSWSIRAHGYSKAFNLAITERAKHTGQDIVDPPAPTKQLTRWAKKLGIILE